MDLALHASPQRDTHKGWLQGPGKQGLGEALSEPKRWAAYQLHVLKLGRAGENI